MPVELSLEDWQQFVETLAHPVGPRVRLVGESKRVDGVGAKVSRCPLGFLVPDFAAVEAGRDQMRKDADREGVELGGLA